MAATPFYQMTSTTKKFRLGTRKFDTAGNEYRYIKAGAALTATQFVKFNGSSAGFDDVRQAGAGTNAVGVAVVAIASGSYGWVLRNGVTTLTTAGSVAVGTALTTGASGAGAAAAATDLVNAFATVLVNSATPQVCHIDCV